MQLYLALPSTVLKINLFCNSLYFRWIILLTKDSVTDSSLQTYKSEHFFKLEWTLLNSELCPQTLF